MLRALQIIVRVCTGMLGSSLIPSNVVVAEAAFTARSPPLPNKVFLTSSAARLMLRGTEVSSDTRAIISATRSNLASEDIPLTRRHN